MTRAAGILVRISDDRAGEALGVERQEQDCRALADRNAWPVAKVYTENDVSAFKRRAVKLPDGSTALRVVRPVLRELLADLTDGTIDALVAYDLDRVARQPRDLEDLIDAVESRRTPTAVVTGDIDLSTSDGVFMARMLVNVANKASRDTSRRVLRALDALAVTGHPGGGARPFGYHDDRRTINDAEATDIRWAHQQVEDGRSLRSIAADLAARWPARRWDAEAVARILSSPRNAGLRQHRGAVVGPATWPGIVTPEQRDRTAALLDDRGHPSRQVGGPRRYLLTGLLACHRCERRLYPRRNAARQRFGCLPSTSGGCGGSVVVYEPAEAHVVALVLARLRTHLEPVVDEPENPAADLRARIADLEQSQADLGRQLAGDPGRAVMLTALNDSYAAEIDDLRSAIKAAAGTRRLAEPRDIADRWDDFDTDRRRAVLDLLIDRVVVGPAGRSGPRFDPHRLTLVWR